MRELSLCSKDALPLARSFYEAVLNAAYIVCSDAAIAERVSYYTIYREFRDQTRHYKLGGLEALIASGNKLSRKDPRVQRALEIFEPSSGGNDRSCFGVSRAERIQVISKVSETAGVLFAGAEGMHWSFASEVAHGTMYGHEYATGQLPRPLIREISLPEEIPFICTTVIALCCSGIGRIVAANNEFIVPASEAAQQMVDEANIYFRDEAPEAFIAKS